MAEYFISYKQPQTAAPSADYEVGILVPVFERFRYLKRTLACLTKSQLAKCLVVFVDDGSQDGRVLAAINNFQPAGTPVMVIRRTTKPAKHKITDTLHENLQFSLNHIFANLGCAYAGILDSDTLVKPNWLVKMLSLYKAQVKLQAQPQPLIVSGFNSLVIPAVSKHKGYVAKTKLHGVNMLFDKQTFYKIFLPMPAYWDEFISDRMKNHKYQCLCLTPSVVQHLGASGSSSSIYNMTFAGDYVPPYVFWWSLYRLNRGLLTLLRPLRPSLRRLAPLVGMSNLSKTRSPAV